MKSRYDVAVMHDFFVDRLVHTHSISDLLSLARSKAREGGGSVHGVSQEDIKGGNAVNLAHSLAVLGAKVLLITHSDPLHLSLLRGAFNGLGAEVRVKDMPPGFTVALEGEANVMMSDSGGASDFPPSLLTRDDWDCLRHSRVVCSVNWAANRHGTSLILALRKRLGKDATLFFNPSDIRDRFEGYARLIGIMRRKKLVDWLSVNEYEAAATGRALGIRGRAIGPLCEDMAAALRVRVDVHTEQVSYTSFGGPVEERRTAWVKPRRLTGAGDVWDAASIFAFLEGMADGQRLEFANAAARLYVKARRARPPKYSEVSAALR